LIDYELSSVHTTSVHGPRVHGPCSRPVSTGVRKWHPYARAVSIRPVNTGTFWTPVITGRGVHGPVDTGSVSRALRFYVPLDAKSIISETFFPANLLACTSEETKPNGKGKQHRSKVAKKHK